MGTRTEVNSITPVFNQPYNLFPILKNFQFQFSKASPWQQLSKILKHKKSEKKLSESQDPSFGREPPTAEQFTQLELNDLVRDLGLSKTASELLASRLKEKKTLTQFFVIYLIINIYIHCILFL